MTDRPPDKEDLTRIFYDLLAEGYRADAPYDYLVLFSGGKDSTYLAHKLKQAKGGRICLFTIDNGIPPNPPKAGAGNCGSLCLFSAGGKSEHRSLATVAQKAAEQLDLDLFIFQPPRDEFRKYYHFLITEDLAREVDANPLCFFCGRYFMALGMEFAARNNIPFVIYGATPMQIHQGNIPRTQREAEIFEMVSRKVLLAAHKKLQTSTSYQHDAHVRKIIDKTFTFPDNVRLIFPFLYLDYDIDQIKATLEKEYGWENPTGYVSNAQYISSGCPMVVLFGLLTKKRQFAIHETDQIDHDHAAGIVSDEAYDYNQDAYANLLEGKIEPGVAELAKIIGVEDLLVD